MSFYLISKAAIKTYNNLNIEILFTSIGILSLIISGALGFFGYKYRTYKPEYQIEKSITGRDVKFLNYDEANRYKRNRVYGIILLTTSIIFLGIGVWSIYKLYY